MTNEAEPPRPADANGKTGATNAKAQDRVPAQRDRSESFPKACRILRRGDFLRIQGHAPRIHGKRLILQFTSPPQAATPAILESRLGLTVSKKVGPSVLRNRLKRWIREAFRRAPPELRPRRAPRPVGTDRNGRPDSVDSPESLPYDLVVTVKRGIDDFTFAALRDELLHGIARYLQTRSQRPARGGGGRPRGDGPRAARRGDAAPKDR